MITRTMPKLGAALLLAAGLLALVAGPAAAAPTEDAYVRLAHLSPDTPQVDVYVDAVAAPEESLVVPGVGYGAVSPYRLLPAGSYVVSMRPAGAPASSPPVISLTVDARPGGAYTIAGVGRSAELGLSVLEDRLAVPAPERASVRVINASLTEPVVDCGREGAEPWARDVRFGTATGYAEVPLGTWNLAVTAEGRSAGTLPVDLAANAVYTVVLVDSGSGVDATLHTDSTGAGSVPVGAVDTGTASGLSGPETAAGLGALAVAVAALAVAVARSSGGRRHQGSAR
jgi:hypothetical protein